MTVTSELNPQGERTNKQKRLHPLEARATNQTQTQRIVIKHGCVTHEIGCGRRPECSAQRLARTPNQGKPAGENSLIRVESRHGGKFDPRKLLLSCDHLLLHFAMAEHCGLGLRVARDPATRLVIIDGLASGGPADRSGGMTAPPSRARCHSL